MFYLLQNEMSVSTHDFQLFSKHCQTQYSLSRVENHAEEIKNYYDGNEMSDRCWVTFCTRWIIMLTFETDLENPIIHVYLMLPFHHHNFYYFFQYDFHHVSIHSYLWCVEHHLLKLKFYYEANTLIWQLLNNILEKVNKWPCNNF